MACYFTGQGAGTAAAVSIKVKSQDHDLIHLKMSSFQELSQLETCSAGGGEHPGGGRQEGAGGAGQARSEDTLGSSLSHQEMLFEDLENIIERSLWEQLIKIGKGSIRT